MKYFKAKNFMKFYITSLHVCLFICGVIQTVLDGFRRNFQSWLILGYPCVKLLSR